MEHENYANLNIFSVLESSTVKIEDYISIDDNFLILLYRGFTVLHFREYFFNMDHFNYILY